MRHVSDDAGAVLPKVASNVVPMAKKKTPSIHAHHAAPLKTVNHARYAATSLNRVPDLDYTRTCVIRVDDRGRPITGDIEHW